MRYVYLVSCVFNGGSSSIDVEANTLKEAKSLLRKFKYMVNNMCDDDLKKIKTIEYNISRCENLTDWECFEEVYSKLIYKK